MELHQLHPAEGSRKNRKRIGRGHGSGQGKTAGKGHKGQNARSGGGVKPGFEGGQMPLQRRVPKRGFNNIFAKKVAAINVGQFERFGSGTIVGEKELKEAGLLKRKYDIIKVIGGGKLTKNLTIRVNKFSDSAVSKIKSAGGIAEVV